MKLPRLHRKGRAWYHVSGKAPRRWIALGSDDAVALAAYWRIERTQTAGAATMAKLIGDFLANPPRDSKWSAGTVVLYYNLAAHLNRVFGYLRPDEISRRDILEYLDRCPRTSAAIEISLLRQVFDRAVRRGQAETNPTIGAKAERVTRAKRTRYLSDAEVAAVRAHAPPVLAVAIELAYLTALRPGDLSRLRWDDFAEHVETQKTGAKLRFKLNDDLRAVLDTARALAGRVSSLTVLSERGRPVTRKRLGYLWRQACTAAGVANAQFRDLRAKSASDDPEQAQQRLGHTSAQTTRTYMRGRQITEVAPTKRRKT